MAFKFNPTTGQLDLDSSDPFITDGADGITNIRMKASDNSLWDFTVDATGAWVSTAVSGATGGSDTFGLLLLRNLA